MDIRFTSEFDAKRYEKLIRWAVGLVAVRKSILEWCLAVGGVLYQLSGWMSGYEVSTESRFLGFFMIFLPLMLRLGRCIYAKQYVKAVVRMMGKETTSQCHLTDSGYETTCGEMSQKMPWKNLGTHYHFFDDDTVVLMMPNGVPTLAMGALRKRGVDRIELEAALRKAGLKTLGESKKRKVRIVLASVLGASFVLFNVWSLAHSVTSYRDTMRLQYVQVRLFELIHGKEDSRRPLQMASPQARVVRAFCGEDVPDSFVYLFDPKDEDDKVGLLAQYGAWAYSAYYPCGCKCCHRHTADCDCLKAFETLESYSEAEKDKWFEKIRPIAKDLYEDCPCCGD